MKPSSSGGMLVCLLNFLIFVASQNDVKKNRRSSSEDVYQNIRKKFSLEEIPFRSRKANLVWEKAMKSLKADELELLIKSLRKQDDMEMELKVRTFKGLDPDGKLSAAVRKAMMKILVQFKLYDQLSGSIDYAAPGFTEPLHKYQKNKKLKDMHQRAQDIGLEGSEMEEFEVELDHLEEKLDFYDQLRNEINNMPEVKNSIRYESNKKDMKIHNKNVNEMFVNLDNMIYKSSQDLEMNTFHHGKVKELWYSALSSNMTKQELASFKTELQHFEKKLIKLTELKAQAEDAEDKHTMKSKHKDGAVRPAKHHQVGEKIKEFSQQLKKMEITLRDQLRPRTEL